MDVLATEITNSSTFSFISDDVTMFIDSFSRSVEYWCREWDDKIPWLYAV